MLARKFKFLRGMSMSEEKKSGMDNAGTKKRATISTFPDVELPVGEFARRAIDNLPEINLKLFKKLSYKPLTDFPHFLELPLKARLIIIRMLFNKDRELRLRVQYRHGEYKLEDFGFPLPATFYVNREFRQETQKHYYFFSQVQAFRRSNVTGVPMNPYCYCLNPKLDKVSVGFQSLWTHNYSLFLKAAFREIPECMRAIHVLEIVNVCQSSFVLMSAKEELFERFLRENLARFHYLKEIRFVLDSRDMMETDFVYCLMEEVKEAFEKEKIRWPHCSLPELFCISP